MPADRVQALAGLEDLADREDRLGIHPGDPILLSPDCRIDELLSLYLCRSGFAKLAPETKRNYTDDYRLFFDFLWERDKVWNQATDDDLADFEYWRTRACTNPGKIGGSRWNRALAALTRLYDWAERREYVARNPVLMRDFIGRTGEVIRVSQRRAKDAKTSNVHWLTPRAFRLWVNVGLRGHTAQGVPAANWRGRLEDRNAAFADLLLSSGMRLTEAGSLLTIEMPRTRLGGTRYYPGRLAPVVTKSKRARTFYASAPVVGEVEGYMESSRAFAIRRAQAKGRYEGLPEMRLVTKFAGLRKKVLHWRDQNGAEGRTPLSEADVAERMTLFTEGPAGPEPLWLWLNESGLPFRPASWENVFRTASERCAQVLDRVVAEPPFCTPHMARHSFALYMLVVLHHVVDLRMGLTPEERRDFRLLYGDPWRMVQDLLGHAQLETTREIYLAGVRPAVAVTDGRPRTRRRLRRGLVSRPGHLTAGPDRRRERRHPGHRRQARPVGGVGMSRRGRKATLPATPFRRPAVLGDDPRDVVVRHATKQGATRVYDFGQVPVAPAMQRSLAVLFAAKCTSGAWTSLKSSMVTWRCLHALGEFLAGQETPPADVPDLTAGVWSAWRLSRNTKTEIGYNQVMLTQLLLRGDSRLRREVRAVMARRLPEPRVRERAFPPGEFRAIKVAAQRTFRSALLRIRENTAHLDAWRNGAFTQGSREYARGEALDLLARTGDLPRRTRENGRGGEVARHYAKALGGGTPEYTWKRLFLTRLEAAALAVLLVTEFGFNATTVSVLPVPRAIPDSGERSGVRVYRLELEKRRRHAGHHFESRNITDHGADSAGRLISDALEATALARAYVADRAPDADRLLVWRSMTNKSETTSAVGELMRVGPFGLGVDHYAAARWAQEHGLPSKVLRRSRKTVNVVHRREPGQNTQDTHDRAYVLPEPQAQQAAVEVIAAGAHDAIATAHRSVLRAQLADAPQPGDQETATVSCSDIEHSPFSPPGAGCGASFLLCTACPNARVAPVHHSRLAHLHAALENLRSVLDPAIWQADWHDTHARLEDLRQRLGPEVWKQARQEISDLDRQIIDDLLNGHFDS
ncbi:site-specific integrase [Streptomyces sp. NPDC001156]